MHQNSSMMANFIASLWSNLEVDLNSFKFSDQGYLQYMLILKWVWTMICI